MKLTTLLTLCLVPVLSLAQSGDGIKFVEEPSWQHLLLKAKAEHKYIFVDAFTTWCEPCKVMDSDVYPTAEVGALFNQKFVSIHLQMDQTKGDSQLVKQWYKEADSIQQRYALTGYPSYLFFSPAGKLVLRDSGGRNAAQLIALAQAAIDPKQQYATLVDNYKHGRKDYSALDAVALAAKSMGDKELAGVIARDYWDHVLNHQSAHSLMTKEHLQFVLDFPDLYFSDGSKGKFFDLFFHHADEIDRLFERPGLSEGLVRAVISKEEISDKLWQGDKPISSAPNWNEIASTITGKYSLDYAESLVPAARLLFYARTRNWNDFVLFFEETMTKFPPQSKDPVLARHLFGAYGPPEWGDEWTLNSAAWDLFQHCADADLLAKALAWSDLSIKVSRNGGGNFIANPAYYDTKANLLYRLGRRDEAIALEQATVEVERELRQVPVQQLEGYTKALAKMKNGEPTWLMPGA